MPTSRRMLVALLSCAVLVVGVIVHPAFGQTTATTTRYVLPYIAVGGDDWTTTITLVQGQFPPQGVSGRTWELRFWAPNGQPYRPTINGQLMTSAVVTVPLTTWGRVDLELTGPSQVERFWCELVTNYPGAVMGYATYRSVHRKGSVSTVPFTLAEDRAGAQYVVPFDNTDGKVTTVAIVNYTDAPAHLYINWIGEGGNALIQFPSRNGPIIPAHSQWILDMSYYSELVGRRGTLHIYGITSAVSGSLSNVNVAMSAWLFEDGNWAFSTVPTMH